MIPYPTNLPQPSANLSADAETPIVRTDIDNGLIEQFGRFATGRESYSLEWVLSNDEFSAFEEWFSETLAGGVLVFGLLLPDGEGYSAQAVRFVGGNYTASHKGALWWTVTARVEKMLSTIAATNRTLPIPQWLRLGVDEALSQNLTLDHRNALLTVRPGSGSTTTFRIYPPTDDTAWIYFGIKNLGDGETFITSEDVDPLPVEGVPSWPALPNVNQAFQLEAKRLAARLDMESGHSRQYSERAATVKTYRAEWDFDIAQLKTFQDFFFGTLRGGSLPFWLPLPVDGSFIPVRVRFQNGRYDESYIFNDTFRVSAKLDRIVDQTVMPSDARSWPTYYAPRVNVSGNIKVHDGAGKLFVVNPEAGQTSKLHIGTAQPEFGLLIVGLGNVLVTRTPYTHDLGTLTDSGAGEFATPLIELRDTIRDLGTLAIDTGSGEFAKVGIALISVLEDIGTLAVDTGSGEFAKVGIETLDVMVDAGTLVVDTGSGEFAKVGIELV